MAMVADRFYTPHHNGESMTISVVWGDGHGRHVPVPYPHEVIGSYSTPWGEKQYWYYILDPLATE
jgi:hypothetical protein